MKTNNQTKFKETEIGTIPEEWDVVKIGNLVEKIIDNRGKTPQITDYGHELIETFQISINEKYPNLNNKEKQKYVSEETYNSWFRAGHPKKDDILFSTVGASIPQWCFVPEGSGYCIAQNLIALRLNRKLISAEFLRSYFNTPLFKAQVNGIVITTAQPSIKVPHLLSLEIALPPLGEQDKIADIIISIEDKIELNQQINANLEKIASSLFKHWFVDFEFPDKNGKPYKSSGGKMIDSELGEIPEGWRVKPMAEVFDFLEGPGIRNWQYAENGTRFINIRLINNGDIDVNSANYINQTDVDTKYQHFLLKENDMILSASGTLGKSAIVRKSHLPLLLNTSVIRFRPKNDIGCPFLYQYLQSRYFLEEQVRLSAGSVQANFGPTHLSKMTVCVPNKKLLDEFNQVCGSLYDQIIVILNQNEKLSQVRDSLLPRLMNGKIRVK